MSEESTEQEKVHYKRRIVVDLQLQMKLIGSFFKIYLLSTVSFFLIVAILIGKMKMYAKEKQLNDLLVYVNDMESSFLWMFIVLFIISSAITYYYGFRITQKVSGPILGIKMYLEKLRNGEEVEELKLRKDDYFLDLQDSLNETIKKLKS